MTRRVAAWQETSDFGMAQAHPPVQIMTR